VLAKRRRGRGRVGCRPTGNQRLGGAHLRAPGWAAATRELAGSAKEEGDVASRRRTGATVANRHRVGSGRARRDAAAARRAGTRLQRVAAGVQRKGPGEVLQPRCEGLRCPGVRKEGVEATVERDAGQVDAAFERVVLWHGRARAQAAYPASTWNCGSGVDGQ